VVRYALARGCVLVAASGNTGSELRYFPAALPGVIAVGAVGAEGRPAPFSTRGDHVCVCAPGEGIRLAGLAGYTESDGTSFAAPFVTGACALMIARGLRRSTPLSPSTVQSLLAASARPFARGVDGRGSGAGVLDVPAALRAVDEACRLGPDSGGAWAEMNLELRGGGGARAQTNKDEKLGGQHHGQRHP
jgi:subtilisin family serine protease